jgi:hypothetical protein
MSVGYGWIRPRFCLSFRESGENVLEDIFGQKRFVYGGVLVLSVE